MSNVLVDVRGLRRYFEMGGGAFGLGKSEWVRALDGVSFVVRKGETLGLVGESGCGKTTLGKCVLRLCEPTAGEVYFEGKNILSLSGRDMLRLRREMQMVFQDPFSSLDPRMKVGDIVGEPFRIHRLADGRERQKKVQELLDMVGLSAEYARRYPHELSGGQRQRIGIARALALRPKLVIADEPVSALDVSVQSQVLNLMQDLKEELGLTYLFVAHDMNVISHVSDRVAIMYLGKMVEICSAEALSGEAQHPYTKALISAIPMPKLGTRPQQITLTGDVPSPLKPPEGCRFHTRCPMARNECKENEPTLGEITEGHFVACHLVTAKA